ncbi:helix-turn-helix transcriptional regulator [Nocardiopsis sp. NPDC049922]|uniref:helix-turn-helix domain-containing protein n=1 Tax=Nocardiopsis sp. NPDC049922 TaxID=3155157 RepID=UPI0033C6AD62
MSDDRGPVVHQHLLIHHLIALRHERGLTQEQVGRALDWSHAKVMRFEGGAQVLPQSMLDALLALYGITNTPLGRKLRALGEKARERAWWSAYRRLMKPAYRQFIGLEAGADTIRQVHTALIPGLLQTRDYTRCVTATWAEPREVEPLVELRMRRQSGLGTRTPRPRQEYLLDETVLRKHTGISVDPAIMPRQLHHLVDMAGAPEVEIRVIPDGHGEHIGLTEGSFILLEFDNDLDDIFYTENHNVCTLTDKKHEVEKYKTKFAETWEDAALPEDKSLELIEHYALSMTTA